MKLYPNPTTGMINVEAEALQSVEVLDMAGRKVMTSNKSQVDLSNLSNGVYMVRVNTANGSALHKIVKR